MLGAYFSSDPLGLLLGHGFGSTTSVTFNGLVAHNSYIELLYTLGVVGLARFIGVAVCALGSLRRAGRMGAAASLVGFLALIMSLSAYSFKPFWAVMSVGFMVASKPGGHNEH